MTEKEILFSKVLDKKQYACDNSMITYTNFFSIDEKSDIISTEKVLSADVRTYYFGGYTEAERTVVVFAPKLFEISDINDYFKEYPDENPIALIRAKKDKFSILTHRDYLGALMGLGIKREMIGDVILSGDYCYIFCLRSISQFICKNLTKAGRGTVVCETCDADELPEFDDNSEEVFLSLASLRLDNIVASGFNISRTIACDAINKGIVYVNSARAVKHDMPVSEKDKIVFRGKGKIILSEIIGINKKGRVHITVKKYK